jgi:hypothetical protein
MNGQKPGLEVVIALGRYFGVPPEHLLRLAGRLPALPDDNDLPPDVKAAIDDMTIILLRFPEDKRREWLDKVRWILDLAQEMEQATADKGQAA